MKEEQRAKWHQQLRSLFNGIIPDSAEWTSPERIEAVLRAIAGHTNHVFLPTKGGQDLVDCQITKDGLLEWTPEPDALDSYAHVCKPTRLVFWNPGSSTREANFVLETGALAPVDPSENVAAEAYEEVVQLAVGEYAPRWAWDAREYQGKELPQGARLLIRNLTPGRFAIFGKGSLYNSYRARSFDAYNAVHNDPVAFKRIVEEMAKIEDSHL